MAQYIKNGQYYDGKSIVEGDRRYISPSEDILLANGYTKVEPQEPSEEEVATYEPTTEERTRPFKDTLASEDYKVIKCMEAYLRGLPLPYDIDVLGAARDAVRLKINKIEEEEE